MDTPQTMTFPAPGDRLDGKRLFIFDLDGTVYLGDRSFPEAIAFISHLRDCGRRVLFFTNNASRSTAYYYERLARMGFAPSDGEIMTAGDVLIDFLLKNRPGKSVYAVATPQYCGQLEAAGITLSETADIVVSSFDTTLTYEKLRIACALIRGGAEYLSTHPDFNCPTEDGFIPDSGAIAALITASTGAAPKYFGKPYPETVAAISSATGIPTGEMCVFGDRLYTDIALGRRGNITSVLALTGETTTDDLRRAEPDDRPDFVVPAVSEKYITVTRRE